MGSACRWELRRRLGARKEAGAEQLVLACRLPPAPAEGKKTGSRLRSISVQRPSVTRCATDARRARGEQAEREHESTCTLLEHDPDFITRGPRAGEENEDGSSRNIVDASVVLGSSERESGTICRRRGKVGGLQGAGMGANLNLED